MTLCFALFDTEIGACGVAWGACGIRGVQLPEANAQMTRARLRQRFLEAREAPPNAAAKRALEGIISLLRGERIDLSALPLDMRFVPPFHRRVYEAARKIAPGTTTTYGELAGQIGAQAAARAVGQALARNPFALIVPCHRVIAANGQMGGFSANGGKATKRRLLAIEGVNQIDAHTHPRERGLAAARQGAA
jgi:methylated-DNA-[protein]-cysteine S-methyltransferase